VIAGERVPGGKLKTLLQIIAICLYLLPPSLSPPAIIKQLAMAVAVVVTLVTGADYVASAVRLYRGPHRQPRDQARRRADGAVHGGRSERSSRSGRVSRIGRP
jgi:phosphatidylglycerophosphate synthase